MNIPAPLVLQRIGRLACKELREILRDRRTIITLFAMPLLLYPLMSVAFQQFYVASRVTPETGQDYRVATLSNSEYLVLEHRLNLGRRAWQRARPRQGPSAPQSQKPRGGSLITWYVEAPTVPRDQGLAALKEALREGGIDLIIEVPGVDPDHDVAKVPSADKTFVCQVYYAPNAALSRAALGYIDTLLAAANQENLQQRLGVPGAFQAIHFLSLQRIAVEVPGSAGVISLAALVPLILILMTITGAVYPAIDMTAGERERGTLEILVAAPVPRFELLAAKYLTVLSVAVLTALVNLTCMSITVTWSGLANVLFQEGLSLFLLVQVFALLLLFAAFFSAVLLCLTSFARSFKEAQAYLIPLMLVSLMPGILAMMPGLKLQGILVVLPLVNIVLLARDLFTGDLEPVIAVVVILTTLLYALAALALAARVFGAETVLYGEQSGLTDLLRRPDQSQPAATVPAALWCLALMIPLQFSLHALMRWLAPDDVVVNLLLSLAVTAALFLVLPALFLYLGRVNLRTGLGLALPRPAGLAAGLVLGASLWPLQLYLLSLSSLESRLEHFGAVLQQMQHGRERIGWAILLVGIVPAILEEWFFRGLLFQALRRHAGAWLTIGATGLLFGLSHVVLGGALGLERLLPSTVLGLLLSAVCWRTGSLWPSLVQHVCHNTILLVVGLYDPGSTQEIPWPWLAGGAAGTLVGVLLLFYFPAPDFSASGRIQAENSAAEK
jgi:ABC-2 type transport system permease protein/sodium transport system permease protein